MDSQLEVELVSQDLEFLHLKVHTNRRLVVPFEHILAISAAKKWNGKGSTLKECQSPTLQTVFKQSERKTRV